MVAGKPSRRKYTAEAVRSQLVPFRQNYLDAGFKEGSIDASSRRIITQCGGYTMARNTARLSASLFCGIVGLVCFLSLLQPAAAQLPTATILGVAKDSSGAVVPDVSLTARNI